MREQLLQQFGNIDIYVFDQILKGRLDHIQNILDAGCGTGRNLPFFIDRQIDVFGIDQNPEAIEVLQQWVKTKIPNYPLNNFTVGDLAQLPYPDQYFDAVVCSAVLHFATSISHFDAMLNELWRVLKPGSMLFTRLASSIGIEDKISPIGNGKYLLPDGSTRFLVDEEMLLERNNRLNAIQLDPIKTTNVQNLRCMTTWVIQKQ